MGNFWCQFFIQWILLNVCFVPLVINRRTKKLKPHFWWSVHCVMPENVQEAQWKAQWKITVPLRRRYVPSKNKAARGLGPILNQEDGIWEKTWRRDLVLRCSEQFRQRKWPRAAWRNGCIGKEQQRDFLRLDGEVWVKKRSPGGLHGVGVSNWKDGGATTGPGQGWNEIWGRDLRLDLNRLDLSCRLGVPQRMLDKQPPAQQREWGSADASLGVSDTDELESMKLFENPQSRACE